MFGMRARGTLETAKVVRAADRANFTNLTHAAAAIRLTARRSIKKAPKVGGRDAQGRFRSSGKTQPSPPGKPPRTRKGQIKRAILYAVERSGARTGNNASSRGRYARGPSRVLRDNASPGTGCRAFIGPTYEAMGMSASAHEFGGRFRGQRYRARPFMGPALKENVPRLPKMWAGSVR